MSKPKPSTKWGFCETCNHEVRWVLGTHHSGERLYRCPGCNSWKAKPVQKVCHPRFADIPDPTDIEEMRVQGWAKNMDQLLHVMRANKVPRKEDY